ncbi:MAG: laccase domain-containing protein [Candidatus Pacebacteria bacterium]|nr:laccase domain-containing protein [Candidatus Paceibacterota bacterium]NUQ57344.1 laccase domain-containing protein [Candidatus Paceibacter sp.]
MTLTFAPATPFKINSEKVSIYLFGKPHNFSPRDNAGIVTETLKFYAINNGVTNIFAPSCEKFNAEVVWEKSFRQKIRFRGGLTIRKGVFADGVVLENRQDAFFVPSADCPTVVATGKYIVIAAHAGRDCLLDKQKIHTGKRSRRNGSVVDAIMEKYIMAGEFIKDLRVFITCGIKAENFRHPINHPQYGKKNEVLINHLLTEYGEDCLKGNPEEGKISLDGLIKTQFLRHGVPPENLLADGIDTFSDNILDEHVWHSCARAKTQEEKGQRNGVFIFRKF